MGLIRDDFGKVAVESRSDSFFVHWGSDDDDGTDALDRTWSDEMHSEFPYICPKCGRRESS